MGMLNSALEAFLILAQVFLQNLILSGFVVSLRFRFLTPQNLSLLV